MKQKTIVLIIVLALVAGAIIFLESLKPARVGIGPGGNTGGIINNPLDGLYPSAPDFVGISSWINSQPLSIKDLRGKVVLVDFWTYSCVNCLRTLPYLNAWYDKYSSQGLVIVSIHTPEFAFEKDYNNVVDATKRYGIKYAVALDNDYATWNAYQNQYWPRKYLIDKNGYIRFDHIGEGGYDETEMQIQELLAETGKNMSTGLVNITDQTPTTSNTPEIYAGYGFAVERGQTIGNSGGLKPEMIYDYSMPKTTSNDIIYLDGYWNASKEAIIKAEDPLIASTNSSIILKFTAKNANIVADGNSTLDIFIDGKYVTKDVAGKDVQFAGDRAFITIDGPRLYDIYDGPYGTYTLQLTTSDPGFSFNSFTFG